VPTRNPRRLSDAAKRPRQAPEPIKEHGMSLVTILIIVLIVIAVLAIFGRGRL
jgi:flagellar basal body-associated protein FliL